MYLAVYVLLTIVSIWDIFITHSNKRNSKLFFYFIIFILILHDGLRWEVGTDWAAYYDFYNSCLDNSEADFEIGYVWVNKLVYLLTGGSYTIFLILLSFFVYFSFQRLFNKYSFYPILSLLILYSAILPYLGMNRQIIAISICLFSVKYILDRKFWPWLLLILMASLFHVSAIVFLISFFLNRELSVRQVSVIFIITLIVSLSGIVNLLPLDFFNNFGSHISSRGESYMNMDQSYVSSRLNTILGILRRGIWLVFLLIVRSKFSNYKFYNLFFNLIFAGFIFYTLFSGTVLQFVVGRGLLYFSLFETVMIPFVVKGFNNSFRVLIFIFIIGLSWFNIYKGLSYYDKDVFYPYKTVLTTNY